MSQPSVGLMQTLPPGYSFKFNTGDLYSNRDPQPPTALPVVHENIPILAHRMAKLVNTGQGWKFSSVGGDHGTFGADADARCVQTSWGYSLSQAKPGRHPAPDVDCSCGFYAVPADKLDHFNYSGVALQVELSGRVIEHELGYRAEHQRVLSWAPPVCAVCGEPAAKAWVQTEELPPVWDCGEHEMKAGDAPVFAATLDQVAKSLGVPVDTAREP
jgi:hypothetical protein